MIMSIEIIFSQIRKLMESESYTNIDELSTELRKTVNMITKIRYKILFHIVKAFIIKFYNLIIYEL